MTIKRYDSNPFLDKQIIPIGKKSIQLSRLGKDDDVLINQSTGEVRGTHVTTYKKVDSEQFVKIFTANIAMTFDLTSAGIKAFNVLVWAVQHKALTKDLLPLDSYMLEEFLECHQDREIPLKLSLPTFKRGISDLEKAQLVAKAKRKGWYYINPHFVFNGDRIAFTTLIENTSPPEKKQLDTNVHGDAHLQDNLPLEE